MNMADPIRQVYMFSARQVQIRPDREASTCRPAA